jgi:predicted phosphodiesterase
MKILVTGDIHGFYGFLNGIIKNQDPDLVIVCGDFGYFPHVENLNKKWENINTSHTKVVFCDGNHDDHWELRKLTNLAIAPNVFYQPRGSTMRLPDGRNILFMGGANSIDAYRRTVGVSWWPEEVISQSDFQNLPEEDIDIFITHTCSNEIYDNFVQDHLGGRYTPRKDNDPSYHALSSLWEMYKPGQWFFGHFHINLKGTYEGTRWQALSAPLVGSGEWWIELTD